MVPSGSLAMPLSSSVASRDSSAQTSAALTTRAPSMMLPLREESPSLYSGKIPSPRFPGPWNEAPGLWNGPAPENELFLLRENGVVDPRVKDPVRWRNAPP
eukprot:675834-Prorocentrum_minimum.AAC.4